MTHFGNYVHKMVTSVLNFHYIYSFEIVLPIHVASKHISVSKNYFGLHFLLIQMKLLFIYLFTK